MLPLCTCRLYDPVCLNKLLSSEYMSRSIISTTENASFFFHFVRSFFILAVNLIKKIILQNECCKHTLYYKILPEIPFV